jgi:hypothetical protein
MVGRCRYHADCAGFWLLSMPSFMNRGRPWAVYPGQSVKALTLVFQFISYATCPAPLLPCPPAPPLLDVAEFMTLCTSPLASGEATCGEDQRPSPMGRGVGGVNAKWKHPGHPLNDL